MRPFFPFYGSKWNTARYYPKPEGVVVEPFAGAAGYATFYDVQEALLVDADPVIYGVWAWLLRATPADVLDLPLLPAVGDSVDDAFWLAPEERDLIGFWLNRGSAQPKRSRTAYSARTDRAQLNWGEKARARIAEQLPRLAGWKVKLGDYSAATGQRGTFFVDPPYGDKGRFYRVRFDEYRELGSWCMQQGPQVIVCENAGADWLPFKPLGSFKSTRGRSEEVVWHATPG